MRLFTGIAIPDRVLAAISGAVATLRPTARIQWSPAANLHITTKFIGEFPEDRLSEVKQALAGVPVTGGFEIEIAGFGWFPNPHNPRILWCGVRAPAVLAQLAAAIDAVCLPLGIEAEKRDYSPHLTVARLKDPSVSLVATQRAIASLPSAEFGRFTVDQFHLYQSKTNPSGSVYTRLADFSLA